MKAALKTAGSAFPSGGMDGWSLDRGMTLRDHFAAQALAGMGMWCPDPESMSDDNAVRLKGRARWAYQQADAMLLERAKP